MLQDYRYVRPHDAAECPVCSPSGPGHPLCMAPGCDEPATFQVPRHATLAEYEATPEAHKPIDGLMRKSVYACDKDAHAEATAPFCTHAEPKADACPEPHCNAGIDQPCVQADGTTPRTVDHAARSQQGAVYDRCLHAHREDCAIFTGCQCTGDDQPPAREPRVVAPVDHADGSRSKLPAELVQRLADGWDIPWWTATQYWTGFTQDNKPMVTVEYKQLDADGNIDHDEHGHEILHEQVIPLDGSQLPPALTA